MIAVLRRSGIDGEWISGGRAAIARLRETPFPAIVLDLMMSEGSGYDVIAWMRSEAPELLPRVIVVTAAASALKSDVWHDVHALLLKPFEVAEFLDAVRTCLGKNDQS